MQAPSNSASQVLTHRERKLSAEAKAFVAYLAQARQRGSAHVRHFKQFALTAVS